jgi:hypothetical protein
MHKVVLAKVAKLQLVQLLLMENSITLEGSSFDGASVHLLSEALENLESQADGSEEALSWAADALVIVQMQLLTLLRAVECGVDNTVAD